EGVGGVVPDRAAEERSVGVADRGPGGGEHVPGTGEEVARARADVLVGRDDHDRAREDREDHRADRDSPRAADDLAEGHGPAVLGLGRLLRRRALRGGVGRRCAGGHRRTLVGGTHAASLPSGAMPAIIRPSTSRGVLAGTMPTMRPRYITRIRSPRARASSSSVATTIT